MDDKGLEAIYEAYAERVYRYLRYRVSGTQDAEDLTCAVFERVCANFGSFDARKGSLETWLFAIARNQLRDHLRRVKRRPQTALDETIPTSEASMPERALLDAARSGAPAST